MLQLKKNKGAGFVLHWKWKWVFTAKLKLSYTFSHRIKLSAYKMGRKFDKNLLAVEQNIYTTKFLNVYIAYDLDAWQRNYANNF